MLVPVPKKVRDRVTPRDLLIHDSTKCAGQSCCFHRPSKHHMRKWPMHVRLDRRGALTERICQHGVGHPDPDSLAYVEKLVRKEDRWAEGVHGCDGCYHP